MIDRLRDLLTASKILFYTRQSTGLSGSRYSDAHLVVP